MILLALVLVLTCMPISAMASESQGKVIDFLNEGYYITDPDGNVVPTPFGYVIDEGVVLKPGYSLNAANNIWYTGNIMIFNAAVSNAKVSKLKLSAQVVGSSGGFTSLGNFKPTPSGGDWYGYLQSDKMLGSYYCYYRLQFTNTGTTTMTIDSLTGEETMP
ncbi:hypothetical protein [Aminipila luticellarii]|uniref:Uncharacterized protein n=1 Tax=Aminipila luticellarii TaxID=2507160 RepID=A0A410PVP3_9FIRM|nr:hypothetical protein [Aminipila luticellarii]QAT42997.1 hypothetical protein EQM06_06970 [Aminipila luticellarii]